MIRFRAIHASHLLLVISIILLIAVLALLGAKLLIHRDAPPVNRSASLVDAGGQDEAKTEMVFASSVGSTKASERQPEAEAIRIEIVRPELEDVRAQRVLIYHTHTHEAYEQVQEDPYKALEAWRTADTGHSVVRVGAELAKYLRGYGFEVVHDTTDHEGNQLSTAYTRSLDTLLSYRERFDLYIDLHRDAYVEGEPVAVSGHGQDMAPIGLLIGNGNGFETKPWYPQNYSFACALERRINEISPGLCKPVLVKDGRYNQQIGVFSILIEVGHNHNTLEQARNSIAPLASAIHSLLTEDADSDLMRMKDEWEAAHPFSQQDAT